MKNVIATAVALAAGAAVAQPGSFIDLGTIGAEGLYSFDTFGSEVVDTELAIYDAAGNVLAENDDNGVGGPFLQSEVSISLTAGEYFLATSEFSSVWEPGFVNSGSGFEGGDDGLVFININGSFAGSVLQGDPINETQFWRVEVVPAPASAGLLAAAGLVARRRR